jgi:hypothetical protein
MSEYHGKVTLYEFVPKNRAPKQKDPIYNVTVELPDGTQLRGSIWQKKEYGTNEPILDKINNRPVLSGKLDQSSQKANQQPSQQQQSQPPQQQQPPQSQPPQDTQGEMPW